MALTLMDFISTESKREVCIILFYLLQANVFQKGGRASPSSLHFLNLIFDKMQIKGVLVFLAAGQFGSFVARGNIAECQE